VRLDDTYQASLATKVYTDTALALKANQSDLAATNALVATKASQSSVSFIGFNFQPRITAFAPLSLVPRNDPQDNPFAELSINLDSYATTGALTLKADTASVYTKAQVDAAIAAAAPNLTAGTFPGGYAVLDNGVIRALKASSPLRIDPDTTNLEIRLDQSLLNSTSQIAALQTAVATKQATLTAGSPLVFHEKLLEGTKVKSLAPGAGFGLSSKGDLVTISASGVNSAVSVHLPVSRAP
jgi:hypothetical protein